MDPKNPHQYGQDFRKYATSQPGVSGSAFDDYQKMVTDSLTPYIIEERRMNATQLDVFSRLMMDRIIFLGTGVDDYVSNIITAQLLFLESTENQKDILLYINSPGGQVYAGMGIYDTMQYVQPEVATICTGLAASMGAVLLAGGSKDKRSALPHARIMIHQPMGGAQGQVSDMEITLRETLKLKEELYQILAQHTGQSYDKIHEDSDRDFWMRAKDAVEYGLIDEVLERNPKAEK